MTDLTYIDLFAGCGGLSDGFELSGAFTGVAHVEIDPVAAKTLANRITTKYRRDGAAEVKIFDIQRTKELIEGWSNDLTFANDTGLRVRLGKNRQLDALIGGPPCQAYSLAGRIRDEHGMEFDYRNYLFESYIKILEWARPKVFVFENVVGILSATPGGVPIVKRISRAFGKAGYTVLEDFRNAVFDLSRYGVPQKRSRVIIVGIRSDLYGSSTRQRLANFYHEFRERHGGEAVVTAAQAIGDLPKLLPMGNVPSGERRSHKLATRSVLNHQPRFHNARDIETFRLLADDLVSGRCQYTSIDALKTLYTERTGKTSAVHKYHVIRPDEPSNTIPAHLYKDGLRHIHWDPKQARTITVREAARLQGFDDSFEFLGSMGDQYRMIGNAVPPSFAAMLARRLAFMLS